MSEVKKNKSKRSRGTVTPGAGWFRAYDPDRTDITPREREDVRRLNREPEAPAVIVAVAQLVPAANEALPADELEARIQEYQRRAALALPMPLFGREVEPEPDREALIGSLIRCWACGAVEGRPSRGGSSWFSRRHTGNIVETYCPGCFDVWGWPEEYAARLAALRRGEVL